MQIVVPKHHTPSTWPGGLSVSRDRKNGWPLLDRVIGWGAMLRANPCPKVTDPSCQLPLLTLFYQPEASHLGDLLWSWVRPTVWANWGWWIFKVRWEETGHRSIGGALLGPRASRWLDRFEALADPVNKRQQVLPFTGRGRPLPVTTGEPLALYSCRASAWTVLLPVGHYWVRIVNIALVQNSFRQRGGYRRSKRSYWPIESPTLV